MVYLLLILIAAVVVALIWRQGQQRKREEREREERRARTDELLAKVLLGENPTPTRSGRITGQSMAKPVLSPLERRMPQLNPSQPVDIDILLGDESDSVADRARSQLGKPTNFSLDTDGTTLARPTIVSNSPISLQSGELDVPLDFLTVAWFEARGYVAKPAPEEAMPIQLLLEHRGERDRRYAFVYDRGRLTAQRAASLLEAARGLGMNKLLVAAEHGADPAVNSARLRDVQLMDWVSLDREMKRIDFRVAAKIIAIARERAHSRG
jgi:hypothetical protein